MVPRIFIQGDRDPQGAVRDSALKIGSLLHEAGYEANVGAYGGFVKLFQESGITIHPHEMDVDREVKYEGVEAVDCVKIADELFGRNQTFTPKMLKELAWGIRIGLFLATSEGFLFFHGREGTLAHLFPVLAHATKGWVKNNTPRPIVLVGWPADEVATIMKQFNISRDADWFGYFEITEINKIVNFLIS